MKKRFLFLIALIFLLSGCSQNKYEEISVNNPYEIAKGTSTLSEKQKEQWITRATLSAANTKYTAEQLVKATGISTETLANWGLIESTDALTISELAQRAASDAQAKAVLDKIIAQNAEAVANGKIIASNTALATSEGGATLATGAFTTAIKANIKAMITWMTTTPLGWLTMLVGGVFLAAKAYDALTVSVKEQKEKMEDSLSVYKDAKSELSNITTELENQEQAMDDLLAKEKLTYAEQGQLEELQAITRELRIQKDLAEKEEGRTQKEVAKDASDLFNKQFGKYDISENAINEYQNNANITGNNAILVSDEDNISSMIAGYRQFNDLLDEAYGSESQEDIDHFKSLTDDLKDSIFETAQDLQEQQSNIADYYNTIKDIPYDDLTTEQKGIVDSYNSISDAIELIYQQLDSNTWKSMQIESVFDTEGIEKTKEELIEMVKAGEFDESTLQSYPKLSAALDQNKVSASELRNELEALADAEGNVKGDTFNDKYPISSFENAWASLATTDNDSLKSLKDDLLELAEAGQLTFETFNETEGSGDFLAQLGLTPDNISDVEDIIKKINELKSSADQLASMKKGVSALSENLYNKQQEPEKEISVDVFAGMDDGLKEQQKEWENYVTVLGNASSSIENVQKATNELATAYVNSNNFLANLTAANKDYYTSQLSAMGVENAEEVVTASLSAQKEILAIKEQALAVTKDGVTASTAGEINALLNEANASETTRAYLFQLTAAEQVFNNQSLDTSGKIRALGELATAYGQTAIAAKIAAWEQAAADSHTQSSYSEADLKHLQEEMNANINSTKIDVNAYAGSAKSGGSGKSGKSGSSAKEESIETFDFIETAIKRIEAAIERLKTKAEETFRSFTSRGREYKKAISEITKEIEIQRQGYDAYIAKANSIGLEESWAGQVRDGSINIADVSDDGLKERIKNYKEWWNHATLFSNG